MNGRERVVFLPLESSRVGQKDLGYLFSRALEVRKGRHLGEGTGGPL